MKSISVTQREEMKKEIKEFLIAGNYQHKYAKLSDNSMSTLRWNDLTQVYQILINNIIQARSNEDNIEWIRRPPCPITWNDKLNQAKIEYKSTMLQYLTQFGIQLIEKGPCNYPPSILEALANYCDKNIRSNNEPLIFQWDKFDK